MEIRRGTPPQTVERTVDIDFSEDDVLLALTLYLKTTQKSDRFKLDNISFESGDNGPTNVRVTGIEVIPLRWPETTTLVDKDEKTIQPTQTEAA